MELGASWTNFQENLLVIDCDDHSTFEMFKQIATVNGFFDRIVSTSNGGHIWIRYQGGTINNCAKLDAEWGSVQFLGEG